MPYRFFLCLYFQLRHFEKLHEDLFFVLGKNVLKVYKIGPNTPVGNKDHTANLGVKIWNELNDESREVLTPFLKSMYVVGNEANVDPSKWRAPLFG